MEENINVMEAVKEVKVEPAEIRPLNLGDKLLIGGFMLGLMAIGAFGFEKVVKPVYNTVKSKKLEKEESAEEPTSEELDENDEDEEDEE